MSRSFRLLAAFLCAAAVLCSAAASSFAEEPGECDRHVWSEWTVVCQENCSRDGLRVRSCTLCGFEETEIIPATGRHTWGSWKTSAEPTYWENGLDKRICLVCGAVDTISVPVLENPFKDVKLDRWYSRPVLFCYNKGYMVGTSDNVFSLSAPVSRAMIVQIMARIAGAELTDNVYNRSEFRDVPVGRWYTRAIEWARVNGMASGTGNGLFDPDDPITRQELAVFMYKLAKHVTGSAPSYDLSAIAGYLDRGEVASWAAKQMSWAVANGIMHGTTPYHLSPQITLTRAQVAEVIYSLHLYFIET